MKKTNNKKTKAHTMRANRFVRTIIEEKKEANWITVEQFMKELREEIPRRYE